MATIVFPSIKLLTQPASVRGSVTQHGNECVDVLSQSRARHYGKFNIIFWPQFSMNCYTPKLFYKEAHSVLFGGNASEGANAISTLTTLAATGVFYGDPTIPEDGFPQVNWKRTSGKNMARAVMPTDQSPQTAEIKVMPGQSAFGSSWSFITHSLGIGWDFGFGTEGKAGQLAENETVAFTVHRGQPDAGAGALIGGTTTPDGDANWDGAGGVGALFSAVDTAQTANENAPPANHPGTIRVARGVFSVLLPGDGGSPRFEKKIGAAPNGGILWETMHTFTSVAAPVKIGGVEEWLITLGVVDGRVFVCINSRDVEQASYIYTEQDPATKKQKFITLPPAACVVSGISDGSPVWFGLRRCVWGGMAQFKSTMDLTDAEVAFTTSLDQPPDGSLNVVGYNPPLGQGVYSRIRKLSKTRIEYVVTLTSSSDRREPACAKFVYLQTAPAFGTATATYTDYGPAVLKFTETQPMPDFSGAQGTRGSAGRLTVTMDIYALDKIAAANGTDWRADFAPYAPVTYVFHNLMSDKTEVEATRLIGYVTNPNLNTNGFHDSEITVEIQDGSVRLRQPAGFIDRRYVPLSFLPASQPTKGLFGWEGVKYILKKAINQQAADNLLVFMPSNWPSIVNAEALLLTTGSMPTQDVPLWNPPYGKYAAEWLKEVATVDFAAFFALGLKWCYGQYDEIVNGLPTIDLYDGTNSDGTIASSQTDTQITYSMVKAETTLDTSKDYNRITIWGKVPDGAGEGPDPSRYGVPLLERTITDFADVKNTWERTWLVQTGTVFDPAFADALISKMAKLTFKKRLAQRWKITMPWLIPSLFWGYQVTPHGGDDINLRDRTLRITGMTVDGDLVKRKIRVEIDAVEVIG